MANEVFRIVEITLQDGTDVRLRPLPIGPLRRFMSAWEATNDLTENEDGFDVLINCSGIALESTFKGNEMFPNGLRADADEREKGEVLSEKYKEYLTETLDLDTIYLVLEVCGGIKLNDPKLLEAAEKALMEAGQTSTS